MHTFFAVCLGAAFVGTVDSPTFTAAAMVATVAGGLITIRRWQVRSNTQEFQ